MDLRVVIGNVIGCTHLGGLPLGREIDLTLKWVALSCVGSGLNKKSMK